MIINSDPFVKKLKFDSNSRAACSHQISPNHLKNLTATGHPDDWLASHVDFTLAFLLNLLSPA
jgi:hypothetical protein